MHPPTIAQVPQMAETVAETVRDCADFVDRGATHCLREAGAGGSNPLTPTIKSTRVKKRDFDSLASRSNRGVPLPLDRRLSG